MDKPRVVVIIEEGDVKEVHVSPKLIEQLEVAVINYDIAGREEDETIGMDEMNNLAFFSLWDMSNMDLLEDELYQKIDENCL